MITEPNVRSVNFTLAEQWGTAIEAWGKFLRSGSKPPTTLYLREYQMRRFASDHPDSDPMRVTLDDLVDWLASFDWKPNTRRSYRSALRSFYNWARASGRCDADPSLGLPAINPPLALPHPAPEDYFIDAMRRATPRVQLMVELAGFVGLRRAEVAKVRQEDVQADPRGWVLFVDGKGRRQRRVPILPGLAAQLRALPTGYLFPGKIDGHLSPSHVGRLISAVLPDGWAAHSLRHRFGTKFFEGRRNIRATQEALGHQNLNTTMIYTLVSNEEMWRSIGNVGLDMTA